MRLIQPVVRMLDRIQRRLEGGRPGSVLILTVVMVVLLALLGTALLSTTRNDRFVATQNTANTQIDMLVEGGRTMIREVIRDDLYGTNNANNVVYRPPVELSSGNATNVSTYDHFDGPFLVRDDPASGPNFVPTDIQNDAWLSPTAPYLSASVGPTNTIAGSGTVMWLGVGTSLTNNGFDSPFAADPATGVISTSVSTAYARRTQMMPTFVRPSGYSQTFPAWLLPAAAGFPARLVLAGDADGDGIADSNLIKFPVGEIDGITYYYCYRVVDNASKVNVNTAWSSAYDFGFGSGMPAPVDALGLPPSGGGFAENLGWFRSHVGLFEMLPHVSAYAAPITTGNWNAATYAQAEMAQLNRLRFNNVGNPAWTLTEAMIADPNTPRTNEEFLTHGDAMEHQLARRIHNPGTIVLSTGTARRARALGLNEAAGLAFHGGLLNLDASLTELERAFYDAAGNATLSIADSLYRSAPNHQRVGTGSLGYSISGQRAYAAHQFPQWFDELYNWRGITGAIALTGGATINTGSTLFRTIRPLVTTWNPVSNQIPIRYQNTPVSGAGTYTLPRNWPEMNPYGRMPNIGTINFRHTPAKTNANTASFEDLWRAYWCVMSGNTDGGTGTPFETAFDVRVNGDVYIGMIIDAITDPLVTPSDPEGELHSQRMFRSPLRDPRQGASDVTFMDNGSVAQLRAAIAAYNTITLREMLRGTQTPPQTITDTATRTIALSVTVAGTSETAQITMYRMEPQPFITEIFVQTDIDTMGPGGANPQGYVCIELYNPYPFRIELNNATRPLRIARINRGQNTMQYPTTITEIVNLGGVSNAWIDPGEYLLLENYDPNAVGQDNSAVYRPASSGFPASGIINIPNVNVVPVHRLHEVLDHEMVLIMGGTAGAGMTAVEAFDGRPIDSFDFSGIVSVSRQARVMHYARPSGDTNPWRFVYPGRYYGVNFERRQQGTQLTERYDPTVFDDPWDPNTGAPPRDPVGNPIITLGYTAGMVSAPTTGKPNDNPYGTYTNTFTIQLMNVDPAGPNPLSGSTPRQFPFGGFARDGDLFQVPFIGAYRITLASASSTDPPRLIEINPITMDAAFAEDTIMANDPPPIGAADDGSKFREHIGRFCPVGERTEAVGAGQMTVNDFSNDPAQHSYAWARKLFDYLTVQSPGDDFTPNVRPGRYTEAGVSPLPVPVDSDGDPATPGGSVTPPAQPTAEYAEDIVPVHGKININTAPWPVLAAIPFVPRGQDNFNFNFASRTWSSGAGGGEDNIELARAIVQWRDGEPPGLLAQRPFKSIFDLYNCPAFAELQRLMYLQGTEPTSKDGDFSAGTGVVGIPTGTGDGVRRDFEEYFLMLTRVSNLITTRSDSFTVYLQVQGWRGVGSNKPELVVQRRVAFIQDRWQVSDTRPTLPAAVNVPND